jgi:3-oxoacyl-[acyl-carrier protein] reductase
MTARKNLSIIITGGGRGLGWHMADALVQAGHRVLITGARDRADLAAACARWNSGQPSPRADFMVADVADWAQCQAVAQRALQTFGRIDALINNAGRGMLEISPTFNTEPALFWQADPQGFRNIIDANVTGAFLMARACVPHMVAQRSGQVVNISTSQVTMVRTGYCPYGPSKAALEAMSVVWAKDLKDSGVSVNVLLPGGATDTRLLPGSGSDRRGADGNLLAPDIMREPIVWLMERAGPQITGQRFTARLWPKGATDEQAVAQARSPAHELPAIM